MPHLLKVINEFVSISSLFMVNVGGKINLAFAFNNYI